MSETPKARDAADRLPTPNTAEAASLYQRLRGHLGVLKLADAAEALPAVLEPSSGGGAVDDGSVGAIVVDRGCCHRSAAVDRAVAVRVSTTPASLEECTEILELSHQRATAPSGPIHLPSRHRRPLEPRLQLEAFDDRQRYRLRFHAPQLDQPQPRRHFKRGTRTLPGSTSKICCVQSRVNYGSDSGAPTMVWSPNGRHVSDEIHEAVMRPAGVQSTVRNIAITEEDRSAGPSDIGPMSGGNGQRIHIDVRRCMVIAQNLVNSGFRCTNLQKGPGLQSNPSRGIGVQYSREGQRDDTPGEELEFDSAFVTQYTLTHTDDRYKHSPITTFGPTFMVYDEDGSTGPLTIDYDEVIYVVEGELTLRVFNQDESEIIKGTSGDVIALTRGSHLDYGGSKGTRLFVVISPVP